ncbi:MAG: AraC family transcriptional regulator [Clostridiales bacterium]|nr:AraC family transcriptional regulator [Clostridiales bacterium]
MSYIISNKQYLAPTEVRAKYEPLLFDIEGLGIEKMDVNFGHPLYTALADVCFVKSISAEKRYFPVAPDGCMTLVCRVKGEDAQAYVCGVIDEIKKVEIEPDEYYVFMRFVPGVGYSLMKDNANQYTNKTLGIRRNMAGGDQIMSILVRDTPLIERVRLISKVIRVYLQGEEDKYLIKYCTEKIFSTQGNIRIEALAEETGFTSRHIGKMFERCVGISPKLYSQIVRLQMSMGKIATDREDLLLDIAVDSGFFDHAHMNRVYKKMIHCSSGEFRKYSFDRLDYSQTDDYLQPKELI